MLARAVPLVLLVAAAGYLILALGLPFGRVARPGAGFYPVIVAVFAVVVALAATASAFRACRGPAAPSRWTPAPGAASGSRWSRWRFCLVLPWVGYPAAAFAFVTVVLRHLGSRWTSALLTARWPPRARTDSSPCSSTSRSRAGPGELTDGTARRSRLRVLGRAAAHQPLRVLHRCPGRDPGRRAARHRARRRHGPPAAVDLRDASRHRADHARGHLLRRHVRRLDHVHPRQRPRRGRLGRHLARRLPDDEEGAGGRRLDIAAAGSFFAGTVGVIGIMLAASWLADVAIRFGPPDTSRSPSAACYSSPACRAARSSMPS